jgi:hypothetical protein
VTPRSPALSCAVCGGTATVMIDPPRRTLTRGSDPNDPSFSVTAILPDMPLCVEHGHDVRRGTRVIGWCDDERCRAYGEIGEASACGEPYKKLDVGNRSSRSSNG